MSAPPDTVAPQGSAKSLRTKPGIALTALAVLAPLAIVALFCWHLLAPRQTPPGQAPLTRLSADSLGILREAFNAASGGPRLILLVSPT